MSEELRIPIIEEEAHLTKHEIALEHVRVRTFSEEHDAVIHEHLARQHIEITRIPMDQEVAQAPSIRTEGDVTIVSILEERLVVEKRLFVVEELHLRRTEHADQVAVPATLRRTRVEIERQDLDTNSEPSATGEL